MTIAESPTMASNAVTFGAGFDQEINDAWRQVEERVLQMSGGDAGKFRGNLAIEDVLQNLDDNRARDKKASEKYSTIRNVFNRTLQCIETVGGIVADGASYAFAPASTCFNALTFVIQAWKGYEGIFESLASLLEKCTEFLDRLTYYKSEARFMDAKLTRVACEHLQIFVEICDHSLKLRSKRYKVAAFMKQMFLNDDEVQGLLENMKNLIDKERGLVSAQTWKSSNEAAANSRDGLNLTRELHSTFMDGKNDSKREKDVQKWKLAIVDALEMDRTIVLDKNTQEPWEKAWIRNKGKIIEGSGEWLIEHELFNSWMPKDPNTDLKHKDSWILGIEGGDGSGKTLLASNVILHLRKMRNIETQSQVPGSRIIVAHNFFDTNSKSSQPSLDAAAFTRQLICQLALADEAFMKSAAAICEKNKVFKNALDMWNQLVVENADLLNLDVVFFIVLDGLTPGTNTQVFVDVLRQLFKAGDKLMNKIRVLITGMSDVFKAIEDEVAARLADEEEASGAANQWLGKVHKVKLGEPNKQDIQLFINNRLNSMDIFKDRTRRGVVDMRSKILEELTLSTQGDFYKINRVLDNISNTDNIEEINHYLESAGQTRPDQIEADIETLNRVRSAKEISEINEIILWVEWAYRWFNPSVMEAAIAIKQGGTGTSLMPLEAKIKTRYTIFTIDADGDVAYKIDQIPEKIPTKSLSSTATDEDSIHPSEVAIIKHYLTTICPPELYGKFGFDDFFKSKMVQKGNYIHKDPDNAHINLLIRCLRYFIVRQDDNRKYANNSDGTLNIERYARQYLTQHLQEVDLSLAERSLKAQAGKALVEFFNDPEALSFFLYLCSPGPIDLHDPEVDVRNEQVLQAIMWRRWHGYNFSYEIASCLMKWLEDSAVVEHVKDHPFVAAYRAATGDDLLLAMWGTAMRHVAEKLFRESGLSRKDAVYSLTFIYRLLDQDALPPFSVKDDKEGIQPEIDFPITLEMFKTVEEWAEKTLEIPVKDGEWEARAAWLLMLISNESLPKTAAEERARKALELDPDNWRAAYVISKISTSATESLALLQGLVDRFSSDPEWTQEGDSSSPRLIVLAEMIYDLGDKYWGPEEEEEGQKEEGEATPSEAHSMVNEDKAIEIYSKILLFPQYYGIIQPFYRVLKRYADRKKWDLIIAFLENLLKQSQQSVVESAGEGSVVIDPATSASSGEVGEEDVAPLRQSAGLFITRGFVYEIYDLMPPVLIDTIKARPDKFDLLLSLYSESDRLTSIIQRFYCRSRQARTFVAVGHGDKAVEWWEESLKDEGLIDEVKVNALAELIPVLVELASREGTSTADAAAYHKKIEDYYVEYENTLAQNPSVFSHFAGYYSKKGDTARVKKLLQGSIKSSLEMLADDDLSNDEWSLWNLNKAFSIAEDIVNLEAVLEVMAHTKKAQVEENRRQLAVWNRKVQGYGKEVEKKEEADKEGSAGEGGMASSGGESDGQPNAAEGTEGKTPAWEWRRPADGEITSAPFEVHPAIVHCDGTCGKFFEHAGGIWHCLSCAGERQFEDECYQKLQDGSLTVELCAKDHKFIRIPDRDEADLNAVPLGSVHYNGAVITVEEWKESVGAKYLQAAAA
ncbi:hypothetical protein B0I35DRAFT_440677 [Stachybotrys elegans]|uniref:Fungal STAND N-terminal Goodbye domain-containing protein n=1 Tax=Stachybotrys elegans TaxID=80388 RepID=A0A8K0SMU6_9HYPO|nr:hypothetical protein B0I35DRAFT_440677 [Stachybotrys elegans]